MFCLRLTLPQIKKMGPQFLERAAMIQQWCNDDEALLLHPLSNLLG